MAVLVAQTGCTNKRLAVGAALTDGSARRSVALCTSVALILSLSLLPKLPSTLITATRCQE